MSFFGAGNSILFKKKTIPRINSKIKVNFITIPIKLAELLPPTWQGSQNDSASQALIDAQNATISRLASELKKLLQALEKKRQLLLVKANLRELKL